MHNAFREAQYEVAAMDLLGQIDEVSNVSGHASGMDNRECQLLFEGVVIAIVV